MRFTVNDLEAAAGIVWDHSQTDGEAQVATWLHCLVSDLRTRVLINRPAARIPLA